MSHLIVHGGRPLRGNVAPSANKNAVLPILCATLLTDEPVVLHRVPDITDVRKLLAFFRELGSSVDMDFASGTLKLHHGSRLDAGGARLPAGMRSSIMLVPALLQRFGRARLEDDVTGCTLGVREIDPHIDVFLAFGAEVELERGAVDDPGAAALRRQRPLARLRVGDDDRELRALRGRRARPLAPRQRRLRAARAGVLRVPRPDGRAHRRHRQLAAAGRTASTRWAAPNTPSPTTSTRSPPFSR